MACHVEADRGLVTITSVTPMSGWMAPVVPTRRNVRTPTWASSSTAIETDGPPIPVEQTTIGTPSIQPSQLVNSRLLASWTGFSSCSAISSGRFGSPGTMARVAPWSMSWVRSRWKVPLMASP